MARCTSNYYAGFCRRFTSLIIESMTVGTNIIHPSTAFGDLGVLLDSEFSMKEQQGDDNVLLYSNCVGCMKIVVSWDKISQLSCSTRMYILLLHDYGNSCPLQWVQNAAARLRMNLGPRDHVTSSLGHFHWLLVHYHVYGSSCVPWCTPSIPDIVRSTSPTWFEDPPYVSRAASIGSSLGRLRRVYTAAAEMTKHTRSSCILLQWTARMDQTCARTPRHHCDAKDLPVRSASNNSRRILIYITRSRSPTDSTQ